jgi:hypothetical protein
VRVALARLAKGHSYHSSAAMRTAMTAVMTRAPMYSAPEGARSSIPRPPLEGRAGAGESVGACRRRDASGPSCPCRSRPERR